MEWDGEVEVEVERVVAETPKALCVRIAGEDRDRWIPKSQISDNSEVYEAGTEGTLVLSPWFAEREGL